MQSLPTNSSRKSFYLPLFIVSILLFRGALAQSELPLTAADSLPSAYAALSLPNKAIRDNDKLNEQIIDLVDVYLVDSILNKKTQRHRVFGGGVIRALGFRWLAVTGKKHKHVGTLKKLIRVPREERLTEYDVNIDPIPHLKKYIDQAMIAFEKQLALRKSKKKNKAHKPPFIPPKPGDNMTPYSVHCELTPPKEFRTQLNALFYPTLPGKPQEEHPNIGEPLPTMGVYGAFVSDCNHKCHPEIHPYEWIWWLNLNPALDETVGKSKTWLIGLFREGSNRFKSWSTSPRIGEVSVPFIIRADKQQLTINLEHLVFNDFIAEGLEQLQIPEGAFDFYQIEKELAIEGSSKKIVLKTNFEITRPGIKWWISELKHDESSGVIFGKIHLAISVKDLYTAKITFD